MSIDHWCDSRFAYRLGASSDTKIVWQDGENNITLIDNYSDRYISYNVKKFKIDWNFKNGKYLIKIDLYGKFYDFDLFISLNELFW